MIRRPVLAAAAAVIALGLPALAQAEVPALAVIGGTSFTLNPMNDYYAGAAATVGGRLALTGPAEVTFRLLATAATIDTAFELRGSRLFSNSDIGPAATRTDSRWARIRAKRVAPVGSFMSRCLARHGPDANHSGPDERALQRAHDR
jgi:hypothetical protein